MQYSAKKCNRMKPASRIWIILPDQIPNLRSKTQDAIHVKRLLVNFIYVEFFHVKLGVWINHDLPADLTFEGSDDLIFLAM